jgi:hypothetical protein
MRPLSRILLGVFLALCFCWCGAAAADPHNPTQTLDRSAFRAVTNMQLDLAFERFVLLGNAETLLGLVGPSSMDCTRAATHDGIETCVVTTDRLVASMPTALAHR